MVGQDMVGAARVRVSLVLETENEREAHNIKLPHVLRALASQTYPAVLTEVIVVDSGVVPELARLVAEHLPTTRIVKGIGLSEYQMKNLGAREATGAIVAYCDGDCAPRPEWIAEVVTSLAQAPPSAIGVQGRTVLRPGLCSWQLSVLLYGLRTDASGQISRRLVSDNCAFRRHLFLQ